MVQQFLAYLQNFQDNASMVLLMFSCMLKAQPMIKMVMTETLNMMTTMMIWKAWADWLEESWPTPTNLFRAAPTCSISLLLSSSSSSSSTPPLASWCVWFLTNKKKSKKICSAEPYDDDEYDNDKNYEYWILWVIIQTLINLVNTIMAKYEVTFDLTFMTIYTRPLWTLCRNQLRRAIPVFLPKMHMYLQFLPELHLLHMCTQ